MGWEWVWEGLGLAGGALGLYFWWEKRSLARRLLETQVHLSQKEKALAQLEAKWIQGQKDLQKLELENQGLRKKLEEKQEELARRQAELAQLQERLAQEQSHFREKVALLEEARAELGNAFRALSSEVLQKSVEDFLKLAQERLATFGEEIQGQLRVREEALGRLTEPLKEALEKIDRELKELEAKQEGTYKGLEERLRNLLEISIPKLQKETENLSRALRHPRIRGHWGEVQLRRVVELAGLLPKCDFEEQPTLTKGGNTFRPDLIVRLPGERIIAVDAKVPFEIYAEALEEEDESQAQEKLKRYLTTLKGHIKTLAQKKYWEAVESRWQKSPEFVVLFLPAEGLLTVAFKLEPEILEFGARHRVLLATPITLMALLKTVAYIWQEQELAENAREIVFLGKQLYGRLRVLSAHFQELGSRLRQTVEAYNRSLRSYRGRILPAVQKLEACGIGSPNSKPSSLAEVSPPED